MDIIKNVSTHSVRVGANEGIVMKIEDLNKGPLYTNGLSGCAVLIIANNKNVFMGHIMSIKKEEIGISADKAEEYITEVIKLIGDDDKNKEKVQIFLGTSDKKVDAMYSVLKKACLKKDVILIELDDNGSYMIELNEESKQLKITGNAPAINLKKRGEYIKYRHINAYAFGLASSGSDNKDEREQENKKYNEEFIEYSKLHLVNSNKLNEIGFTKQSLDDEKLKNVLKNVGENWNSINMFKAVVNLCENMECDYDYVQQILQRIDKHVKEVDINASITEQNRIDICKRLIDQSTEENPPSVEDVVDNILNPNSTIKKDSFNRDRDKEIGIQKKKIEIDNKKSEGLKIENNEDLENESFKGNKSVGKKYMPSFKKPTEDIVWDDDDEMEALMQPKKEEKDNEKNDKVGEEIINLNEKEIEIFNKKVKMENDKNENFKIEKNENKIENKENENLNNLSKKKNKNIDFDSGFSQEELLQMIEDEKKKIKIFDFGMLDENKNENLNLNIENDKDKNFNNLNKEDIKFFNFSPFNNNNFRPPFKFFYEKNDDFSVGLKNKENIETKEFKIENKKEEEIINLRNEKIEQNENKIEKLDNNTNILKQTNELLKECGMEKLCSTVDSYCKNLSHEKEDFVKRVDVEARNLILLYWTKLDIMSEPYKKDFIERQIQPILIDAKNNAVNKKKKKEIKETNKVSENKNENEEKKEEKKDFSFGN